MKKHHLIPTLLLITTTLLSSPGFAQSSASSLLKKGDHIAFVGNTFIDQMRNNDYLETFLTARLPKYNLKFRNLGWAGDTPGSQARPYNFSPLENDLTNHATTVILACFGMGDAFAGPTGVPTYETELTTYLTNLIAKTYDNQAPPRLALITPIACEDLGDFTPRHTELRKNQALYVAAMQRVTQAMNIPLIDVFAPTAQLADSNGSEPLTINGIHLTNYGYWAVSRLIADQLTSDPQLSNQLDTSLHIQATPTTGDNTPIDVAHSRLPDPAPPAGAKLHTALANRLPRLTVTGLAPGNYTLMIGDRAVATATGADWNQGLALKNTPAQQHTQKLHEAINDKNIDFFHRWRALNTVHIVGQRKSSPAGQALPGELLEMDKIIATKDQRITQLTGPAPSQTWTLVRQK